MFVFITFVNSSIYLKKKRDTQDENTRQTQDENPGLSRDV